MAVGRAQHVSRPFGCECLNLPAMTPFPASAHRTGRAELLHPALGLDSRAGIRKASLDWLLGVEISPSPVAPRSVRAKLAVRLLGLLIQLPPDSLDFTGL